MQQAIIRIHSLHRICLLRINSRTQYNYKRKQNRIWLQFVVIFTMVMVICVRINVDRKNPKHTEPIDCACCFTYTSCLLVYGYNSLFARKSSLLKSLQNCSDIRFCLCLWLYCVQVLFPEYDVLQFRISFSVCPRCISALVAIVYFINLWINLSIYLSLVVGVGGL